METFYEIKPALVKRSAVALGFFDGVHCGHRAVIKAAVEEARQLGVAACIATFRDHPRSLTLGRSPELLTSLEQRLSLFADLGVDLVLALPFTEQICRLSAREYVEGILLNCLAASCISVGYNHCFGRERQGNPQLLAELGQELNFTVKVCREIFVDGIEVSSSRIRSAIKEADLSLATSLLGRPYALSGKVVHGDGRGRAIGYPTANLQVNQEQLLPRNGVYAGMARLPDGRSLPCVINHGYRPTVDHQGNLVTEVHVLNFQEDLYDCFLSVEFWNFLRPEMKFENVDALKTQIGLDCKKAKGLLPGHADYASSEQKLPA